MVEAPSPAVSCGSDHLMIQHPVLTILLLILVLSPLQGEPRLTRGVTILCYHHIGSPLDGSETPNVYTVPPALLRAHFDLLRKGGFTVISFDDYLQYARGKKSLPEKSVLLTFDDGYQSFVREALPLLREFRYPAVLAVVGSWPIKAPEGPDKILDWNQLREIEASGSVEIVSHSYDLHRYVPITAFGDRGPVATNREYTDGRPETDEAHREKIRADLRRSQEVFQKELGRKARALAWPYGEYNEALADLALAEGFEVLFALDGGFNAPGPRALRAAKRGIIWEAPPLDTFGGFLARGGWDEPPVRTVQIDLDALYDPNRAQFDKNISLAIQTLRKTFANTVFLQAYSDTDGDGNISEVYFANTVAPVRADVFGHVSQRLTDAGFRVYAWMPTLAGQWMTDAHPDDKITASTPEGAGWYRRASPFSPRVRESLTRMFREMAMSVPLEGILFQDDLYMTDYEDFSPAAQAQFRARFHRSPTQALLNDPEIRDEWTRMKSQALNDLTRDLLAVVRQYRPDCRSARNIYAEAVADPAAFEWYAQDFQAYLRLYDFTVVMAYPYMERKGDQAIAWLQQVADAALKDPANAPRVMFKLQSYDWSTRRWIPRAELNRQVRALLDRGILNVGYYPENLYSGMNFDPPF